MDLFGELQATVDSWEGIEGLRTFPPAEPSVIMKVEEALEVPLPPALRVFYAISDGLSRGFGKACLLPCDLDLPHGVVQFNDPASWLWAYAGLNDRLFEFLFVARNWNGHPIGYRREDLVRRDDPDPPLFMLIPHVPSNPIPMAGLVASFLQQRGDRVMQLTDPEDLARHKRFGELDSGRMLMPGVSQLISGIGILQEMFSLPLIEGMVGLADLTRHRDRLAEGTPIRAIEGYHDEQGRQRLRWQTEPATGPR